MPRKQAIKLGEANIHLQSNWMHNLPKILRCPHKWIRIFFFPEWGPNVYLLGRPRPIFLVSLLIGFSLNSPGGGEGASAYPLSMCLDDPFVMITLIIHVSPCYRNDCIVMLGSDDISK